LIGLRIASIFILLVSSTSGALFPIFSRRSKFFRLPDAAFL
jgi:zinc transporter 1/2/3